MRWEDRHETLGQCPRRRRRDGTRARWGGRGQVESAGQDETTCGEYGTSVQFEDTPADAAKQAKKDEKLVMVLHVSGHFENPEFT